ncbi:MAG: Cna B-type domain-containing protein [Oscillospiraceae bacterium]|nr:Cna B-type domain-containing protein [Oscillospiraceae bacterium]
MKSKRIPLFLIVLLLAVLPLKVMAQQFDYNRKGSISVTLAANDSKLPMAGAEFSVYYVATVGINTDGNLNYIYTGDFAPSGISLDDPDLVQKLNAFVSTTNITAKKMVTDSQGMATCSNLALGMYFVKQTGDVKGFATCAPFLVTVPMQTDSGYQYDVNASPKTDVARVTDITIKKVWNTGGTSRIPASVTVQLMRGKEVVETAILNKQNNWQITYQNMPLSDEYHIKEINVPKGYAATYSKMGYVFTVINTPALAQTGQLVWPIPVFALAGMLFLTIGFVFLRKPGKADA